MQGHEQNPRDPYAPPPRHTDKSGGIVRLAIVAALLGAATWGYMEYSQTPQTAFVAPAEEELAQNEGYTVAPVTEPAPGETANTPEAPAPDEPS